MPKHPFQRLSSPSRVASLFLHSAGVASFAYSFHFLTTWDTPLSRAYGWHFQFLTIIGLAASLLSFTFGALADLTLSRTLFQLKNAVSVVATPLEVVISILYWGITAIDKKLVVPEGFELATHIDVGFHLAPAVLLTLDLLLFSPPWTVPAYGVMALSTVIGFSYWYWVELCFSHNGWYPYPLFGLLSTVERAGLFIVSASMVTISSSVLKVVYTKLNGSPVQVAWKNGKARRI